MSTDDLKNKLMEQILAEQELVKPAIEALLNEPNPTVDYMLFGEVFLPYFARDENPKYPNITPSLWLAVAKNHYNEVDIIGPNGEVVGTVPPMYERDILEMADMSNTTEQGMRSQRMSQIMANTDLLAARSALEAERYMLHATAGKMRVKDRKERMLKRAKQWNDIFIKYGRVPIFPELVEDPTKAKPSTNTANTVVEEDDFEPA